MRGNAAGGRASRPPGAWTVDVPVARRPTLHGGPVWLRTCRELCLHVVHLSVRLHV